MLTSHDPEPTKRKTRGMRATYLKVANGNKENAWSAGPTIGVFVHRIATSQPCRHKITEGGLQCAYCGAGLVPEWRGYVPLWDRDQTLRFVLINYEYLDAVRAINLHAEVVVSRAKSRISPCVVRAELWCTSGLRLTEKTRDPVDLWPALLTIWQDDELTQFHLKAAHEQLTGGARSGVEFPLEALAEKFDADAMRLRTVAAADEKNAAFVRSLKDRGAGVNGKAKK